MPSNDFLRRTQQLGLDVNRFIKGFTYLGPDNISSSEALRQGIGDVVGPIVDTSIALGSGLAGTPIPKDDPGARLKAAAATPATTPPTTPVIPGAPRRPRSLLGIDTDPTSVEGVRRISSDRLVGGAPLFTNLAVADATRGFEALTPERQAVQDANNTLVDRNALLSGRSVLSADGVSTIDAGSAARARQLFAADEAAAREAKSLADARSALSLGIRESLARGISPQGLQAATQGLATFQPAPPEAPDLGGLASLLNAQTSQGQLDLGERRLAQENTIAENRAQAASEKSVLKLAAQLAADPTGAIDPTKFATALGQVSSLFGINPAGGVDGGNSVAVSPEALANRLRSKGVPEAEIQQHLKQKFGQ